MAVRASWHASVFLHIPESITSCLTSFNCQCGIRRKCRVHVQYALLRARAPFPHHWWRSFVIFGVGVVVMVVCACGMRVGWMQLVGPGGGCGVCACLCAGVCVCACGCVGGWGVPACACVSLCVWVCLWWWSGEGWWWMVVCMCGWVGGEGKVGEGAGRIEASERVFGRCPVAVVCNIEASLLQRSRIRGDHTKTNRKL